MSLSPGVRLGPYEILSALGAGAMGVVYRRRTLGSIGSSRSKSYRRVSDDPSLRERFDREARSVGSLNHPHICTLHDVGHQDGVDYLVLEYLEGQTLADRLPKGALPLDQALSIAIQVADALDRAHRAGIVHRDLKPGNIMLTKSGAKLLDFGLAKASPAPALSSVSVLPDCALSRHGSRDHSRHAPVHGTRAGGRSRGGCSQRHRCAHHWRARDSCDPLFPPTDV